MSPIHRPRLDRRLRALRLVRDDTHVVPRVRRLTMLMSFVLLFGIPLSGAIRVDLWAGEHLVLGRLTPGYVAVPVIPIAVVCLYLFTFLINWGFGRLFCGYGCPVGQLHRIADLAEIDAHRGDRGRKSRVSLVAFAALLVAGGMAWWVSPRVLWAGSPIARATVIGVWIAGTGVALLHARRFRWSFCKSWCPIGTYYTAIQLAHSFGVQYDRDGGQCTDCGLCQTVCPIDLDPRRLGDRFEERGGIALDAFPGRNYCLSCGDCVRACAFNLVGTVKAAETRPALTLGFGRRKSDEHEAA